MRYVPGNWTRSNVEMVLLGVQGRVKRGDVRQLVLAQRHSTKPTEVRERIVQVVGDVPRLEIFAREVVPGWDHHGNELPGGVEI